jgi:hypothetical protein
VERKNLKKKVIIILLKIQRKNQEELEIILYKKLE